MPSERYTFHGDDDEGDESDFRDVSIPRSISCAEADETGAVPTTPVERRRQQRRALEQAVTAAATSAAAQPLRSSSRAETKRRQERSNSSGAALRKSSTHRNETIRSKSSSRDIKGDLPQISASHHSTSTERMERRTNKISRHKSSDMPGVSSSRLKSSKTMDDDSNAYDSNGEAIKRRTSSRKPKSTTSVRQDESSHGPQTPKRRDDTMDNTMRSTTSRRIATRTQSRLSRRERTSSKESTVLPEDPSEREVSVESVKRRRSHKPRIERETSMEPVKRHGSNRELSERAPSVEPTRRRGSNREISEREPSVEPSRSRRRGSNKDLSERAPSVEPPRRRGSNKEHSEQAPSVEPSKSRRRGSNRNLSERAPSVVPSRRRGSNRELSEREPSVEPSRSKRRGSNQEQSERAPSVEPTKRRGSNRDLSERAPSDEASKRRGSNEDSSSVRREMSSHHKSSKERRSEGASEVIQRDSAHTIAQESSHDRDRPRSSSKVSEVILAVSERGGGRRHRRDVSKSPTKRPKSIAVGSSLSPLSPSRIVEAIDRIRQEDSPNSRSSTQSKQKAADANHGLRPESSPTGVRSSTSKVKSPKSSPKTQANERDRSSSPQKQTTKSTRAEVSPREQQSANVPEESTTDEVVETSPRRTIFQLLSPKNRVKDTLGRSKSALLEGSSSSFFAALSPSKRPSTDATAAAPKSSSRTGRTAVRRSRTNAGMEHTLLRAPSLSPSSSRGSSERQKEEQDRRKFLRRPSGENLFPEDSPVPTKAVVRKPSSARSLRSTSRRSSSQLSSGSKRCPSTGSRGERASDNSTISSYNNDSDPAPVLQFDPDRSSALQLDLKDILTDPIEETKPKSKPAQPRSMLSSQDLLEEPAFSFDDEDTYGPFQTHDAAAMRFASWDEDDCSPVKPKLLYPSESEDESTQSKPALAYPSATEDCDDRQTEGNDESFSSFGQLISDSFHEPAFALESGDEGLSNRKLENQRLKQSFKKKPRELPRASPDSFDAANESESSTPTKSRSPRVRRQASGGFSNVFAPSANSPNGQLTDETETEDEMVPPPVLKSLAVTVSNNQTPYESEVDMTPRQTPLKKRMGFSQYFRGKMKSTSTNPVHGAAPAETSDSEVSFGSKAFRKKKKGSNQSMLLHNSSGSENEAPPLY